MSEKFEVGTLDEAPGTAADPGFYTEEGVSGTVFCVLPESQS